MTTEHIPVFPRQEKWQCSCGFINDFITYTCINCGKTHVLSTYLNPCDRCRLCGKKSELPQCCDWMVHNNVRY